MTAREVKEVKKETVIRQVSIQTLDLWIEGFRSSALNSALASASAANLLPIHNAGPPSGPLALLFSPESSTLLRGPTNKQGCTCQSRRIVRL